MLDIAGTLVDSNVLLDVATADPIWSGWSETQLATAVRSGPVFINPLIYAETSFGFERVEDVDDALPPQVFIRAELPYQAGFLAGHAFSTYRHRGGAERSPLPDFYIGAHAAVAGLQLLTRDATRYQTYFPTVTVIAPTSDGAAC